MAATAEPPFPRGKASPSQSPRFWVHHKDRYLRQILIKDIEEETKRDLIVYFTDCDSNAQIDGNDDTYLVELLGVCKKPGVDLMIETNGGWTDATEKMVSILRGLAPNFRVIVPRRAKSNGTLIALAATKILMGANSELGPIDPFVNLAPGNVVPADFILQIDPALVDPVVRKSAESVRNQTRTLAQKVLETGMLKTWKPTDIEELVKKLSSRTQYHSHGSVIDAQEAKALGLDVEYLDPGNDLWKRIWLLRTMYEFDCKQGRLSKIFEGSQISSSIALPLPTK